MANERWEQIDHLFHLALETPAAERNGMLAQQCAGDEALQREVESLLTAHEQPYSVFAQPAADLAADWFGRQPAAPSIPPASLIGQRLRHYQILSVLGKGGMGEVYLAEDTQLDRRVALKLLPAAWTTDADRVRRFMREAKAVSALNHPNILTIHEIGSATVEQDSLHFLVTEYIEGETLRERISRERLSVTTALEMATQIAGALCVAHEAGIVHRDIKPENVMLRPDGYVKVLDFGLAKLTEARRGDAAMGRHGENDPAARTASPRPPIAASQATTPGAVMGTASYMSPEQARGQKLDARTDIFSLGVTLYEMLTGCPPFNGSTTLEIVGAILHEAPAPLARHFFDAPEELERVITKALCKDREQRYQTIQELLFDLRQVNETLVRQTPHRRLTGRPNNTPSFATATTAALPAHTTQPRGLRRFSERFQRRWLPVMLVLTMLFVVAFAAFFYFNRGGKAALTDKDTILLGGFRNRTGDEVFDETLRQGLAVQLEQTPFLQLFSEQRIRETLQQMGRSPDEMVTPEIGREICERQGLKAVITGDIAPLGGHYVLTLEAINGKTGETLAREQLEAPAKEQVLQTLSQAGRNLRKKLGESLASVEQYSALLEATTTSLPALRAFTLGMQEQRRTAFLQAIPFFQRAVELDPNFASAWAFLGVMYNNTYQPQRAAECATRAYELRTRVTERERFRIMNWYYGYATGEIELQIEVLEQYRRTYPREAIPLTSLFSCYSRLGQYEQAEVAAREALRLTPENAGSYKNHAYALLMLNRLPESRAVLQRLQESPLSNVDQEVHFLLACLADDEAAQQQILAQIEQQSNAFIAWQYRARRAHFRGQWRQAEELSRPAQEALRQRNPATAAAFASEFALHCALLGLTNAAGNPPPFAPHIQNALALTRDRNTLSNSALTYAISGHRAEAQALLAELAQQYPRNTLINRVWLRIIRAAINLHAGQSASALEELRPVERYEASAFFWPQYLRGLAYLQLRAGPEAATEFRKITEHRSYYAISPLWPLANLGLARALALTNNATEAKKAYETFLALWKDADADLPLLKEARREVAQYQ